MKNKKLEKLNGELFEQLTINCNLLNLEKITGGEVKGTSGWQDFNWGGKTFSKKYTDKQNIKLVDGVWELDGCPYGHIFTIEVTCGVTYIMCGKTFEAREFKDKINYHIDKKKGIVYDGLPYDYVLLKPLNNTDVSDGYSDIINTHSL